MVHLSTHQNGLSTKWLTGSKAKASTKTSAINSLASFFFHTACFSLIVLTEQEITGDVLLDLDVNLLKTEIGIMAFGKRMRIANAIVDLRRPPSPSASFSMPQAYNAQNSPQHQQYAIAYSNSQNSQPYPHSPQFAGHSRTQSQSHSHQSYNGHQSLQSSVGSPLQNGYLAQTYGAAAGGLMSPESVPHTGDLMGSPMDVPNPRPVSDGERIGLGISMGDQANSRAKGRPAQLTLSPSDGALNVSATQTDAADGQEDERAIMSEVGWIFFLQFSWGVD
jgi:hypothetical protein